MEYTPALLNELNLLIKFPETQLEGLKIHHTAEAGLISAAQQLFDKGLITQKDGGYLTDLGHEAAETASTLIGLISPQ